MGIPVREIDDIEDLKTKGPTSVEAIAAGISFLQTMTKCVCENTAQKFKYGIDAQLNLGIEFQNFFYNVNKKHFHKFTTSDHANRSLRCHCIYTTKVLLLVFRSH